MSVATISFGIIGGIILLAILRFIGALLIAGAITIAEDKEFLGAFTVYAVTIVLCIIGYILFS